ncbi:MAG: histidine--tRNA ligase, partial [Proteobacteria bacterium]|nr:histidine--tRNA ligase [Pseudomonadota bacterium]
GSFKAQMKRADASGAAFAIILGEDEMAKGVAVVKSLRAADQQNNQTTVAFEAVIDHVVDQIVGADEHDHSHDEHIHYHH